MSYPWELATSKREVRQAMDVDASIVSPSGRALVAPRLRTWEVSDKRVSQRRCDLLLASRLMSSFAYQSTDVGKPQDTLLLGGQSRGRLRLTRSNFAQSGAGCQAKIDTSRTMMTWGRNRSVSERLRPQFLDFARITTKSGLVGVGEGRTGAGPVTSERTKSSWMKLPRRLVDASRCGFHTRYIEDLRQRLTGGGWT